MLIGPNGHGLRAAFRSLPPSLPALRLELMNIMIKDGLPHIAATHDRNNPRSCGVMQNIGMDTNILLKHNSSKKYFSYILELPT